MKTKVMFVDSVEEFNELRNVKDYKKVIMILLDDLDFGGKTFEPIEAENLNLVIYGNGFKLSNLVIDTKDDDYVGIFNKINSLYIRKTNLLNINTKGNNLVGSLAGQVGDTLDIKESKVITFVNGQSVVGGLAGKCHKTKIKDSLIATKLKAKNCFGFIAGEAEVFNVHSNTFVQMKDNFVHKELTENEIGPILKLD